MNHGLALNLTNVPRNALAIDLADLRRRHRLQGGIDVILHCREDDMKPDIRAATGT